MHWLRPWLGGGAPVIETTPRPSVNRDASPAEPWYRGVTRYQWLVLAVASLGWIFDAFEGQLYNITRADMLPGLLKVSASDPMIKLWGERFLGVYLIGGTVGGWLFSSMADK